MSREQTFEPWEAANKTISSILPTSTQTQGFQTHKKCNADIIGSPTVLTNHPRILSSVWESEMCQSFSLMNINGVSIVFCLATAFAEGLRLVSVSLKLAHLEKPCWSLWGCLASTQLWCWRGARGLISRNLSCVSCCCISHCDEWWSDCTFHIKFSHSWWNLSLGSAAISLQFSKTWTAKRYEHGFQTTVARVINDHMKT